MTCSTSLTVLPCHIWQLVTFHYWTSHLPAQGKVSFWGIPRDLLSAPCPTLPTSNAVEAIGKTLFNEGGGIKIASHPGADLEFPVLSVSGPVSALLLQFLNLLIFLFVSHFTHRWPQQKGSRG